MEVPSVWKHKRHDEVRLWSPLRKKRLEKGDVAPRVDQGISGVDISFSKKGRDSPSHRARKK